MLLLLLSIVMMGNILIVKDVEFVDWHDEATFAVWRIAIEI